MIGDSSAHGLLVLGAAGSVQEAGRVQAKIAAWPGVQVCVG